MCLLPYPCVPLPLPVKAWPCVSCLFLESNRDRWARASCCRAWRGDLHRSPFTSPPRSSRWGGVSQVGLPPAPAAHSLTSSLLLQRPVSWMVQEMDGILAKQKVVNCKSEKAKWWEGRRALDSQVEVSVKEDLKNSAALTKESFLLVKCVSETVKGDGGIVGMLEELASTSFSRCWAVQTSSAPLQLLVGKGSESWRRRVEGAFVFFLLIWTCRIISQAAFC